MEHFQRMDENGFRTEERWYPEEEMRQILRESNSRVRKNRIITIIAAIIAVIALGLSIFAFTYGKERSGESQSQVRDCQLALDKAMGVMSIRQESIDSLIDVAGLLNDNDPETAVSILGDVSDLLDEGDRAFQDFSDSQEQC